MHNSIDAAAFRALDSWRDFRAKLGLDPQSLALTFTNRFIPEKEIQAPMEATALLAPDDVQILLDGDSPLKADIEAYPTPNVHLLGTLGAADICALPMRCFLLPTRSEGFSTSLLEATAFATMPTIANVGGVQELIPTEEFGMVLHQTPGEEITRLVPKLKADPNLSNRGKNLRHPRLNRVFLGENRPCRIERLHTSELLDKVASGFLEP